jgi:hypothetical protein
MVDACFGVVQMLASHEELCPIELSNKCEQSKRQTKYI